MFIGVYLRLFGKFCCILREKYLPGDSPPAYFCLVCKKFGVYPHIFPMNTALSEKQHPAALSGNSTAGIFYRIVLKGNTAQSVWRLCTPSACKFPFRACFVSSRTHLACIFSEIFRENTRKSTKDFLRFPFISQKSDDAISSPVRYGNRLSYFTKMLVNTSSIHSLTVFIDEKFDDTSCYNLCARYNLNYATLRTEIIPAAG